MATTTNPKSDLATEAKRAEVVQHRLAGKANTEIARLVGITEGGVRYHTKIWLESQQPSAEQTEELRQLQAAQLDALHDKLWPRLDSDDYLAVTDRLVKLMDRKARLMGLDLERNVQVNVLPSAEALAAAFGWDASTSVVEGTAVEVTET